MTSPEKRQLLKTFLRTRRAAVSPETVGFWRGPRRRTPGLRREELAVLANVGVTWYTWLEQGRDIQVSRAALMRIGRALCLSESDTRYLLTLAELDYAAPPAEDGAAAIGARIQSVVDAIVGCPAFVRNPRLDVVAFNRLANAIYDFDGYPGPFGRNSMWRACMDPVRRRMYVEWERVAEMGVGMLRANYASRVGDASFEALIEALVQSSPDFERLWRAQQTAPLEIEFPLLLDAPGFGRLALCSTHFPISERSGYALFVLTPADDDTAAVLSTRAPEPP
jgi:transcriptional regulator with XRE-family HTH domain